MTVTDEYLHLECDVPVHTLPHNPWPFSLCHLETLAIACCVLSHDYPSTIFVTSSMTNGVGSLWRVCVCVYGIYRITEFYPRIDVCVDPHNCVVTSFIVERQSLLFLFFVCLLLFFLFFYCYYCFVGFFLIF